MKCSWRDDNPPPRPAAKTVADTERTNTVVEPASRDSLFHTTNHPACQLLSFKKTQCLA
jgi:hypothetical protein